MIIVQNDLLLFPPPLGGGKYRWLPVRPIYLRLSGAKLRENWLLLSVVCINLLTNPKRRDYYFTPYVFFTPIFVGGLSLESEWQQISSSLQDSS